MQSSGLQITYLFANPLLFCLFLSIFCFYFFFFCSLVKVSGTLSMWVVSSLSVGTTQSEHCSSTTAHRNFHGEVLCLLHRHTCGWEEATELQQHR